MPERADVQRPRLFPWEAAGTRPAGLAGWVALCRRWVVSKLRGEQDLQRLVAQGLNVGRDVYIARGAYLDPGFVWLISIGDETTLGPHVTILTHDATPKLRTGYSRIAPVRIGARVFIGANATLLPGVTVGDDSIVGAGSVVRRDVPPGIVVFGNPAVEEGPIERHTDRHLAELARRPRFSAPALAARERRRDALAQLKDGSGYVE